ncbi:MAG: MFS transporter [Betaproteobacteria bacterium]|nr:MFS transporter [Betaproteobacteria bacterium]
MAIVHEDRPMSSEEKKVIFASSLGTVFEWYDFYLYGSLAAIIAKQFFSGLDAGSAFIFALLAFAAGFIVRPFGAIFFGRLGDMIGRKYTFLVTILIMGLSTFIVGVLPTYASIGVAAPIILIGLRLLQGLALGGEYGGAATYVAEHAPYGKRGAYTAWIQTTATLGLFLSLLVILGARTAIGEEAFADWGWRIPFLVSIALLAVSVVWYTGQFYALFFLTQSLKVDGATANLFVAASLIIGTPFFIVFGVLSDKIGRKPIIMLGCLLAVLTYFPVFEQLTKAANPDLHAAQQANKVVVIADPAECSFQFNPTGTVKFTSSCDIAKQKLAANSVSYSNEVAPAGTPALIKVGEVEIKTTVTPEDVAAAKEMAEQKLATLKAAENVDAKAVKTAEDALKNLSDEKKSKDAVISANLSAALKAAGYPAKADPAKVNKIYVIVILTYLVILVTMVYGPIAAMLVEMFPTRIRYTSMSLPYHIGNGWFGGLLPTTAFAIVAQTGNMYNGLWYPIIIAGATFIIGTLFIKETKDVDIYADD